MLQICWGKLIGRTIQTGETQANSGSEISEFVSIYGSRYPISSWSICGGTLIELNTQPAVITQLSECQTISKFKNFLAHPLRNLCVHISYVYVLQPFLPFLSITHNIFFSDSSAYFSALSFSDCLAIDEYIFIASMDGNCVMPPPAEIHQRKETYETIGISMQINYTTIVKWQL